MERGEGVEERRQTYPPKPALWGMSIQQEAISFSKGKEMLSAFLWGGRKRGRGARNPYFRAVHSTRGKTVRGKGRNKRGGWKKAEVKRRMFEGGLKWKKRRGVFKEN